MVSLNKVFLGGNLTRDPELRYTPSGMAVTDVRLAINRAYLDKQGDKKEETTFVDVVVWGKQAETVCQYLKKGSAVLVEGALQFDSWEQEGQKRSKIRVKASRVQFLSAGRGGAAPEAPARAAASGPQDNFSEPFPSNEELDEDIPF